ncbi:TetR family transcriptional regulator [Photobacterium sanctipauli]|uniref:TetR family transcriptional regulator n=1 Tax=Photobacterium sanctipauli TaxID=1342794 RepID=A0A2T3NGK5_9GAMM|nr:TetR family transcriptional regulator [Photobacterium sanctipauli]PSW13919.1 TetR family transcriptional regulator [Photobacterium sanctipauli]
MARKSKEEAELTRQLLLDTAMKVFSEKGLAKTTLASIAKEAGLTRGAIYWHFKDKADLLEALWKSQSPALQHAIQATQQLEGIELKQGMLNTARVLLVEMHDNPKMRMIMQLSFQCFADESLMETCIEQSKEDRALMLAAMECLHGNGILHDHLTPKVAATIFESLLTGVCEQWLMHGMPERSEEEIESYIQSLSLALYKH